MAIYPEGTSPLPMDDVQRAANKANEMGRQALGQNGAVLANSSSVSGNFVAVQAITEVILDDLIAPGFDYSNALGNPLPIGFVIYGPFTTVSSATGIFIAYKA